MSTSPRRATPGRTSMDARQVLLTVLRYSLVLAVVLAVVGGGLGYLAAGLDGLVSALIGTAIAVVFSGLTALSLLAAIRFDLAAFFGIVMGSFLLKMVLFLLLLLLLRDQPFVAPAVLFVSLVVALVGTVAIDSLVVHRSRMPYVSDVRPHLPSDTDRSA